MLTSLHRKIVNSAPFSGLSIQDDRDCTVNFMRMFYILPNNFLESRSSSIKRQIAEDVRIPICFQFTVLHLVQGALLYLLSYQALYLNDALVGDSISGVIPLGHINGKHNQGKNPKSRRKEGYDSKQNSGHEVLTPEGTNFKVDLFVGKHEFPRQDR